jgi:DNA polymerase-3 subunit gamma/tau
MLLNDVKYDLYIFDRFFRIISDSKQLLNMNSDGGFVLILTLSKMVEAVNLKTIDEVINDVQNIQVKINKEIKEKPIKEIEIIKDDVQVNDISNPIKEDNSQILFKKLVENIYNKSYDLGECFEKSFIFSSYENNILKINSTAVGDCKVLLYKNFSHIKIFVADVFGETTELAFEKIKKEQSKEKARIVQPYNTNNVDSMTEETINQEIPSSCVAGMSEMKNPNLSQIELNIDDVLNSKMTNTAVELLQPRNPIKIKSKL